ncbi:MAG TPA: phosphopantetheine-binding protein, partial [Longimicrobiaceae bacterium]|nr:phosphopantetheine-binding protein [Longimicrobiaceae bacterium]
MPGSTEGDRRQVAETWNATAAGSPERCIHELFAEQAERTPEAVAVEYEDRSLTYAELEARAGFSRVRMAFVGGDAVPPELLEEMREAFPAALVAVDCIPRTSTGKTDRGALPAPDVGNRNDYVAPRGPAEELVAAVWAEALGVERVVVHNGSFDLGGHSLLAMTVAARLAAMRLEVPVRLFFQAPTLEAFVREMTARETSPGQTEQVAAIALRVRSLTPEARHRMLRERQEKAGATRTGGSRTAVDEAGLRRGGAPDRRIDEPPAVDDGPRHQRPCSRPGGRKPRAKRPLVLFPEPVAPGSPLGRRLHVHAPDVARPPPHSQVRHRVDAAHVQARGAADDEESVDVRGGEPALEEAAPEVVAIGRQGLAGGQAVLGDPENFARTLVARRVGQRQLLDEGDGIRAGVPDVDRGTIDPSRQTQVVPVALRAADDLDRVL